MRHMDDKHRRERQRRAKLNLSSLHVGKPALVTKNRSTLQPSEEDHIRANLKTLSNSTRKKVSLAPMPWDKEIK